MATISFPASLPNPTLASYTITPFDNVVRSEMESGLIRARRRSTSTPGRVNLRWIMNQVQFGIFEAWYSGTAHEGTEYVNINIRNGSGTSMTRVRFLSVYNAVPLSNDIWEVSISGEIPEPAKLSNDDIAIFTTDGWSIESLRSASNQFRVLVRTTLPREFNR